MSDYWNGILTTSYYIATITSTNSGGLTILDLSLNLILDLELEFDLDPDLDLDLDLDLGLGYFVNFLNSKQYLGTLWEVIQ